MHLLGNFLGLSESEGISSLGRKVVSVHAILSLLRRSRGSPVGPGGNRSAHNVVNIGSDLFVVNIVSLFLEKGVSVTPSVGSRSIRLISTFFRLEFRKRNDVVSDKSEDSFVVFLLSSDVLFLNVVI